MTTRRRFLKNGLMLGCSAAASPLMTPVAFAAAPWDQRLVVIVLRGGLDGLHLVQPYADPNYAAYRPSLASPDLYDLDGFYGLHPDASALTPLWEVGELGFTMAVSTPYRDKRSHFDGQDILQAGGASINDVSGGWLNRLVGAMPGTEADIAYAIGQEQMLILSGQARVNSWSPDVSLDLSPHTQRLLAEVYDGDFLFEQASFEAIEIAQSIADSSPQDMALSDDPMMEAVGTGGHVKLAEFAADRLVGDSRIASFSLSGWDTHRNQSTALRRSFRSLADVIVTLRHKLGPIWSKTTVVAVTEFGRSVAENGSQGTDHGTGGVMITAGGGLRGRRVVGDWPGLAEVDLYDRRDLLPTRDIRAHLGWLLRGTTGVAADVVREVVFPDVELGSDPGYFG